MGIEVKIKSIAVVKDLINGKYKIDLSVEVLTESYQPGQRPPRIELFFSNQFDNRRLVLPNASSEYDEATGKGTFLGTYSYFLDYMFWDCKWKDCRLTIDVDYDNKIYENVPFSVDFIGQGKKDLMEIHPDSIDLHIPVEIDSLHEKQPNALQTVLAILLKICSYLFAVLLTPFFVIDVLGMLTLHTEYVDPNLNGGFGSKFMHLLAWRYFSFCRNSRGSVGFKTQFLKLSYLTFSAFHPRKRGIMFLSNRRNDLTGNMEYVYGYLKKEQGVPFYFWLHPEEIRDASIPMLFDMARKLGKALVVVTDDYVPYFQELKLNRKTKLVQLWHACGAFKTFGFSRTGKPAGPKQTSTQHRNYNYAFVSSKFVAKYYAEGFGLAQEKIIPYGVPRTDIFWDEEIKEKIRKELYDTYPELKNKKVILFAPTFRGNGKNSAYYEKKRFDPNRFIEALPEEYILLIKHHPFVNLTYKIKDRNASRVFDFSDKSEINHLLFITDVMITDYSSVVYEASILNIPMLFYAYDLENYISSRDFYTEYKNFVPGKIVRTQEELVDSILNNDCHQELVKEFCQKNFDIQDGKASKRVADFILNIAKS